MENKNFSEEEFLLISGIQHFSFCRRQWALIHIEQLWNENGLTAEGRVIHERVHDSDKVDIRNGILTMHNLQIKSKVLGITGCCDAVEFIPSESGISLKGRNGLWNVYPVEYKHGHVKNDNCDRLQLAAQVICLEEMFCCDIREAALFYHETRRREKIVVSAELRDELYSVISEMHALYERGYTPKVKPHKGCKSCSMSEVCMNRLQSKKSVYTYIDDALSEGECK